MTVQTMRYQRDSQALIGYLKIVFPPPQKETTFT